MENDELKKSNASDTSSELNRDSQNKKRNKWPIILSIVIIIAILAALAIAGLVIMNISQKDESSNEIKTDASVDNEIKKDEKENNKKITKIIAEKEMETDSAGKYTTKVEVTFENGELINYKASYYNLKDEYLLERLKETYEKAGLKNRIEFGENSFSYELTGEEFLEGVNNKAAITRNYFVSQFKKQGCTVTIEGDDSFLSDAETKSENTENGNQSNEETIQKPVDTLNYENEIEEVIKKTQDYINSEEGKKAQQEALQKANEYIQNNQNEINDAAQKAQDYLNSEEGKKAQQEALQKANEYIQNNQEQIDAVKKQTEQMLKQYGY